LHRSLAANVAVGSIASVGLSWHVGFTPDSGRIAITVFKYSDTAMKAVTENPQDRGAAAAKLAEAFGGKMEAAYWFSSAGDYDGMVVWLLPNDQAAEALNIMTRASGNFSNTRTLTATRSIDRTSVSRRRQKPCLANSAPRSVL
jgi:uncharacterized protein with GYD domain